MRDGLDELAVFDNLSSIGRDEDIELGLQIGTYLVPMLSDLKLLNDARQCLLSSPWLTSGQISGVAYPRQL